MVTVADLNGDNEINFEEFVRIMLQDWFTQSFVSKSCESTIIYQQQKLLKTKNDSQTIFKNIYLYFQATNYCQLLSKKTSPLIFYL